jgi:two-component sensor histidine kinase
MSFIKPIKDSITDLNENGKYLLIWRLSLILSILFSIATLLTYFVDFYSSILYMIALAVCIFCFVYLNITKKIKHIFWIFTISASLVVTFSTQTLIGTLHYPDFIWGICTIVFAYIGLGKRVGLIFLFFHLISICYFFIFTINIHLEHLKTVPFGQQISVMFEMLVAFFALTYLINQYLIFQSRTERQLLEANQELEKKNNEINLLMKEIHHRIKNNLQLVISLLRMQRDEINSQEVQLHFTEAINRVMSISIIHQKLYQKDNLKNFNFKDYINELIQEIKLINETEVHIDLLIDIEDIGLKTLVPMGLLLNELISNSFKHAFTLKVNDNKISIKIDQYSSEQICLYYEDNGLWKENKLKGFGLELVEMLTTQLEGTQEKQESKYIFKMKNLDLD